MAGSKSSQVKVFVTHSGLERVVEDEDSYFVARASEPEMEVEILSRLLLFMGLTQQNAQSVLANYKPFLKRAHWSTADKSTLVMTGSLEFVWSHTLRALDRLGLDVVEKNKTQHELKVVIQRLSKGKLGGEDDEVSESSYIMQWFRGDGKDAAEDEDKQFILKFIPKGADVTIRIQDINNELAESVLAEQVGKGLLLELK